MGLHKRHTHGHVFRGLEAREQLQIRKRDSHGDRIKMNIPEGFPQKEVVQDDDTQTAVSVVYVTLSQTFEGPAIYSTMGVTPTSSPEANAQETVASSANDAQASYEAMKSSAQAGNKASTTATSVATVTPHSSNASPMTTLATATSALAASSMSGSMTNDAAVVGGTPLSATRSATPDAAQQSSGMTGGAKAGLAIGIIAAIALAAGLIFFCYRRQKAAKAHEELMDEKHGSFADAGARRVEAGGKRDSTMTERVPASIRSTRTASTAPRLSLRPVTQFLPNLTEQPRSNGNTLEVSAAGVSEKPRSAWEREPSHAQNPFADNDATILSEKQARPDSPPTNPFDEPEGKKSSDSQGSNGAISAATTAVGAAAAAGVAGKKHSPKSSWEGSEPATPKSTKFGTAAAVPVAAAGAAKDVPPPRGPNNVHRVQLDFKPSMDDELELRSGQLVRMLHEYDDGWALCIRMDRSQQGVAPRTCLSKLPVKPRPQGPPPPQGSRPGTAQGPRRPSNPPAPNGVHGAMIPRPLTPTQSNRSPSPTETNGEASTTQAGVPARKPVPGQAM